MSNELHEFFMNLGEALEARRAAGRLGSGDLDSDDLDADDLDSEDLDPDGFEWEDLESEEMQEALRNFAHHLLSLPFFVEYPDTKELSIRVTYEILRSMSVLANASGFSAVVLDRCRRTIGGIIPRFPQRMMFYQLFDIPIDTQLEYTLQLIDDQLAWTAPWHRGFGPLTQRLVQVVSQLHAVSQAQCAAHAAGDLRTELDAAAQARALEYEIWDVLDDGVSSQRHLAFLAGLPI